MPTHNQFKDLIPHRVPEHLRDREYLNEYLETCGEIFDEFRDTIKAFDYYKDYKRSEETRLAMISRRFAFDPPGRLEEHIVRGIIRDLTEIYRTNGIRRTITWIMRILSWDAAIEELWLVFPERYQNRVREVYPDFYTDAGLDSILSQFELFVPLIGRGYRIGIPFQSFAEDINRIVDGPLLIGENNLLPQGAFFRTDPFDTDAGFAEHFDVDRIDIRNFVVGRQVYRSSGVYFQGRTQFSSVDNLFDLRILGERYPTDHIRRDEIVMKTPYITIDITSDDYDQFVDGTFTEREKFNIAQRLIQFLLYDLFRPLNMKVISLLAPINLKDSAVIKDDRVDEILFDEDPYVETNPYFFPDAPSYQHFDSVMAITIPSGSEDPAAFQSTDPYQYSRNITTTEDGGYWYSNEVLHTRTPSTVTINSDTDFSLEYKEFRDSDWVVSDSYVSGTTSLQFVNVYELRLVFASEPTTVTADVEWHDQRSVNLTFPLEPIIGAA